LVSINAIVDCPPILQRIVGREQIVSLPFSANVGGSFSMSQNFDVAIIGGGPAGSTLGSLLSIYNPRLKIVILEREKFPRDHVGESQLPGISRVLAEMGCWDKVEAANFPIKIGATYRWGRNEEMWDFEFLPGDLFKDEPRPAKYVGQRRQTAFQIDRSIYDKILLDHAASLGCIVREETTVRSIRKTDDRVDGLTLDDGSEITARYYVDASGHSGILRRAMDVKVEYPSTLQNIAIWDYWRNAEWAVNIGIGGTRIQVLSLSYGWLWFIPLGPDRTSLGLVIPAKYYKDSGKRPEELYREAVESDPIVSQLLKNATSENRLTTTKDWSFVSERLTGKNWFLVGESAGFADPILSAGMTLAHSGARDVAYTILALDRKEYEPEWLKSHYCQINRAQIRQHISFADFWYSANGLYKDLRDHARNIAEGAGLSLTSEEAWQWMGQGGFVDRSSGVNFGGFHFFSARHLVDRLTGDEHRYIISDKTHFIANLEGAEKDWTAEMANGQLTRRRMYRRNGKILPMRDELGWLVQLLKKEHSVPELLAAVNAYWTQIGVPEARRQNSYVEFVARLEALVADGWITARVEPGAPVFEPIAVDMTPVLHENRDIAKRLTEAS